MSGFGTGIREGCHRNVEGRLSSELRLPCFTSLSRRLNVMTALRRSSPGAQLPGAVSFACGAAAAVSTARVLQSRGEVRI